MLSSSCASLFLLGIMAARAFIGGASSSSGSSMRSSRLARCAHR